MENRNQTGFHGKKLLLPVLFFVLLFLVGCAAPAPVTRSFFAMDTVFQVRVFGATGEQFAERAEAISAELEASFSISAEEGICARVKRAKAGSLVPLSQQEQQVLQQIQAFSGQTDGLFDLTVGSLKALWREAEEQKKLPCEEKIREALQNVGPASYHLEAGGIVPQKDGVMLDFGAVAKGVAADCMLEEMEKQKAEGFVSLGGCIACRGKKPGEKPFRFGLKTPVPGSSGCFGTLTFPADGVLSTSGDYERFYDIGGRTYSHILNPKTGRPAESLFRSVTVFGSKGAVTDMLSTYLMFLSPEEAFKAAQKADCSLIAVGKNDVIYLSKELEPFFSLNREGPFSKVQVMEP